MSVFKEFVVHIINEITFLFFTAVAYEAVKSGYLLFACVVG